MITMHTDGMINGVIGSAARNLVLWLAQVVLTIGLLQPAQAIDIANPFNKPATQPVRDKWAVIIGIGQFQDPAIPVLRFADKSALELSRVLKDPQTGRFAPDHVRVLAGSQASKQAIEDVIAGSGLVKKALPNDLIVLYFSTRIGSGSNGDPFLCASDTLVSEIDSSGVDLKSLLAELRRRVLSKRILCIFDTSPVGAGAQAPAWDALAKSAGVTVWAANETGEPPCELVEAGTSAFLHYLTEGLKTASGQLSFSVVSQYTADSVRDQSTKIHGQAQTPALVVAPEDSDIGSLKVGIAVKSSAAPAKVAIGHNVDDLAMKRPDLARARNKPAPPPDEQDDDQEEQHASAPVDFGSYMTEMKKSIQKRWQPPKGFENRRVVTVFTIHRDGTISQPSIVEGSGVPAVDQTALDALKAASPLPPLPLGAPKSVQIRYQFDWRVNRN